MNKRQQAGRITLCDYVRVRSEMAGGRDDEGYHILPILVVLAVTSQSVAALPSCLLAPPIPPPPLPFLPSSPLSITLLLISRKMVNLQLEHLVCGSQVQDARNCGDLSLLSTAYVAASWQKTSYYARRFTSAPLGTWAIHSCLIIEATDDARQ